MNYLLMASVFFSTGYRGSLDEEVSVLPKPTSCQYFLHSLDVGCSDLCFHFSTAEISFSHLPGTCKGGRRVMWKEQDAWDLMKTE